MDRANGHTWLDVFLCARPANTLDISGQCFSDLYIVGLWSTASRKEREKSCISFIHVALNKFTCSLSLLRESSKKLNVLVLPWAPNASLIWSIAHVSRWVAGAWLSAQILYRCWSLSLTSVPARERWADFLPSGSSLLSSDRQNERKHCHSKTCSVW